MAPGLTGAFFGAVQQIHHELLNLWALPFRTAWIAPASDLVTKLAAVGQNLWLLPVGIASASVRKGLCGSWCVGSPSHRPST